MRARKEKGGMTGVGTGMHCRYASRLMRSVGEAWMHCEFLQRKADLAFTCGFSQSVGGGDLVFSIRVHERNGGRVHSEEKSDFIS